jgi:hypothetical protein
MKPNTQQSTVGLNHTEQLSCMGGCAEILIGSLCSLSNRFKWRDLGEGSWVSREEGRLGFRNKVLQLGNAAAHQ